MQLNHIVTTPHGSNALGESPEIITMAVKLIGTKNLSVASAAVRFLSDYGRTSPNMAHTLLNKGQDSHLRLLKSTMAKSDEIRYRVFEVLLSSRFCCTKLLVLSQYLI